MPSSPPAQLADLPLTEALARIPPEERPEPTDLLALGHLERRLVRAHVEALVAAGAWIVDPARTWIGLRAQVEPGATLWPDTVVRGNTTIGAGAIVHAGCWIEDSVIGPDALIRATCVLSGAVVGARAKVGPMAHLRPGTRLDDEVHVGNFVETKNAHLAAGAKANHLTYLGDAEVGPRANVGAGTITCNYDGAGKYRTSIGADAFIGSNSSLVAPIAIGDGAIVGAGSVITRDVPPESVALERAEQRILEGRAPAVRERNRRRARGDV